MQVRAYFQGGRIDAGTDKEEEGGLGLAGLLTPSSYRHRSLLLLHRLVRRAAALASARALHAESGRVAVDRWYVEAPAPAPSDSAAAAEQCEGRFVVEVIDSGAGISKENQAKLFREVGTGRWVQGRGG